MIAYVILQENITSLSVIEMNRKAMEKSLEVYVVSSLVDVVVGVSVKFLLVAPLYWKSNLINLKIETDVGGLKRDEKIWKGESYSGWGDLASPPLNDPLVPLATKAQFNAPDLIFTSAAHKDHQI